MNWCYCKITWWDSFESVVSDSSVSLWSTDIDISMDDVCVFLSFIFSQFGLVVEYGGHLIDTIVFVKNG